jgi:hypothetical protein
MKNPTHIIEVEFEQVESTLQYGLRVGWINGIDKKSQTEVDLSCGAGVGGRWLMFTKSIKGKQVIALSLDVSKLIGQLDKIKPVRGQKGDGR